MLKEIKNNRIYQPFFLLALIMTVFSAVAFTHGDTESIVKWAKVFLEETTRGNLYNYQNTLLKMVEDNEIYTATNYPLICNAIVAILFLPLWIVDKLLGYTFGIRIYFIWMKLLVVSATYLTTENLYQICLKTGIDKKKSMAAAFIFFVSPFAQLYGIGMGQIDIIEVFLMLAGFRYYMEDEYKKMTVFFAIGFAMKPFIIFVIAPVMVFMWFKDYKKTIISVAVIFLTKIISKLSEKVLVENYEEPAKLWNDALFLPKVFTDTVCRVSYSIFFLAIAGIVCYYIVSRGKLKSYHLILFPGVLFSIFEITVANHPQWYLYGLVFLIIMAFSFEREYEAIALLLLFYASFIIYSNVVYDGGDVAGGIVQRGIFGEVDYFREHVKLGDKLADLSPYFMTIGASFMAISLFAINFIYILDNRNKLSNDSGSEQTTSAEQIITADQTTSAEQIITADQNTQGFKFPPAVNYIVVAAMALPAIMYELLLLYNYFYM